MNIPTVLTDRFDRALLYATHVHGGQVRKGTSTPYVVHLLAVSATVLEYGGDEDLAIAALLHDSVEDQGGKARLCDGVTRRDFVRLGALGAVGLGLPELLRAEAAAAAVAKAAGKGSGREKNCILFFLMGGQSQLDMWDMKPDAPEMIRGEFKPINTNVDGIQICEHMPQLARRATVLTA